MNTNLTNNKNQMEPLTKKESTLAAVVGVVIGTVAGLMISLSMLKEHKKCEGLKRENRMLQEMVMQYQDREYVAN
jgi:gas vesicle protein